jgi:Zn finger protein HypA/HybF involved in hydrogenase expression
MTETRIDTAVVLDIDEEIPSACQGCKHYSKAASLDAECFRCDMGNFAFWKDDDRTRGTLPTDGPCKDFEETITPL